MFQDGSKGISSPSPCVHAKRRNTQRSRRPDIARSQGYSIFQRLSAPRVSTRNLAGNGAIDENRYNSTAFEAFFRTKQPNATGCRLSHQSRRFHSLPSQQFQALLTLFSKSFSSSPHGTCVLSVPNSDILLEMMSTTLFAFQSRGTRLWSCVQQTAACKRTAGLSPSLAPLSKRLAPAPPAATHSQTTIQVTEPDLSLEPFPVHSPLLGESCLVTFPPLTYMLKFSRWAHSIACPIDVDCAHSGWWGATHAEPHNPRVRDETEATLTESLLGRPQCCKRKALRRRLASHVPIDAEGSKLPGSRWQRGSRSSLSWFTELCISQCVSHFTAPVTIARTETLIVESVC